MQGKLIASYRRELSALDDLQCAGTVTYTLTQEADAFVITVPSATGHGQQRVCCVR